MFVEERRMGSLVKDKGVVSDSDEESEGETVVHPLDSYGVLGLSYRASLLTSRSRSDPAVEHHDRRASSLSDITMANGQSTAG